MTAAQDRWRLKPWYCGVCCVKSTQGHRKRHEASAAHKRLAALDYGIQVAYEVKRSDHDFADYIALFRPQRLAGYELDLYLRAKTPDYFEMEAA